jgi:hypothetical protein
MTTIDIKQNISILWNRGAIINIQRLENKDLSLRFYDLQTLEFFNVFTVMFKDFQRDEDDFSELKYLLDDKRAFLYVFSKQELRGYSLMKVKKDDSYEVLADWTMSC